MAKIEMWLLKRNLIKQISHLCDLKTMPASNSFIFRDSSRIVYFQRRSGSRCA